MSGVWLTPTLEGTWVNGHPLYVGSQTFRRMELRDEDDFLADATVTGVLSRTGAANVSLTVARESAGIYLVTFPVFATAGIYSWRIAAAGAVNVVERGRFRVLA